MSLIDINESLGSFKKDQISTSFVSKLGAIAFHNESKLKANPYEMQTKKYDDWRAGWLNELYEYLGFYFTNTEINDDNSILELLVEIYGFSESHAKQHLKNVKKIL